MHWEDVQVERILAEPELRAWALRAFALDEHEVAVGKQYDDPTDAELASRVLVLWDIFKGEFPFRVTVVVRDHALNKVPSAPAFDALARVTQARLIVFDDAPEPDHVVLVTPDGTRSDAYVDSAALDDDVYQLTADDGRRR